MLTEMFQPQYQSNRGGFSSCDGVSVETGQKGGNVELGDECIPFLCEDVITRGRSNCKAPIKCTMKAVQHRPNTASPCLYATAAALDHQLRVLRTAAGMVLDGIEATQSPPQ